MGITSKPSDDGRYPTRTVGYDWAAVRLLDEVSTNEIEKIIQQLSQPQHNTGMRP